MSYWTEERTAYARGEWVGVHPADVARRELLDRQCKEKVVREPRQPRCRASEEYRRRPMLLCWKCLREIKKDAGLSTCARCSR